MAGQTVARVLVIHGKGMEKRGLEDVQIFGPLKLADYEAAILGYARELGLSVAFFHSNEESAVADRIGGAGSQDFDAVIINPAGYLAGAPRLAEAIGNLACPRIEVHISNPASRGVASPFAGRCTGTVTGFGVLGYRLALAGLAGVGKGV